MSGLLWLALDGVGHPADAPPGSVWDQPLEHLGPLVEGGRALDATLGLDGLPQSGTGQSCWLTGQDAAALMGEHFGPVPGPTLQRLLREAGLPLALTRAGGRARLLNRYSPAYLAPGPGGRNRLGCFPFAFHAAGLPLSDEAIPLLGASLGLDSSAPWLPQPGQDEAKLARHGESLALALRDFDLLVADLWLGDWLGHQGADPTPPEVLAAGRAYLRRVDALLAGALAAGARVILSSDHGNLEDLWTRQHTRARVPFGGAGLTLAPARDIVEGGQAIWRALGLRPGPVL